MEIGVVQIIAVIGSVFSFLSTLIVGSLAFFMKRTLDSYQKADEKNAADIKEVDKKQTEEVEKLKTQINELKSDLPLVYVLREDFIRTLNNVDKQMSDMNVKLDKILQAKIT
jgi:septal ring factor EnvC (AmiA/AmiB activator)|nr:MAG TPA: hypothetical protein [Caudoviricetes sp.]